MHRLVAAVAVLFACAGCASTAVSPTATIAARQVAIQSQPAIVQPAPTVAPTSTPAKRPYVFLIVLENESFRNTYLDNPHPYLGRSLQQQGTLLTHYYATGHLSLDNYISMISGQAPNRATSLDCEQYVNFNHTTKPATLTSAGQAVGTGCVYPSNVVTLGNQLSAAGVTWRGYMQSMGSKPGREQGRCGVPHTDKQRYDDTQSAVKIDQYAARHNPFVYFHSLVGTGLCARHVVRYGLLRSALRSIATTAHFNFITPNLCSDGHDAPCVGPNVRGTHTGGLAAADYFLEQVIPRIKASAAYRSNGLIIITSDESIGDSSACCGERPGPSDKMPGLGGPGGGRIGALLIGRCVSPAKRDGKGYNHYSLLRSLEDLYGISTGGSDGKGHLGYAGALGLRSFGSDAYGRCSYG